MTDYIGRHRDPNTKPDCGNRWESGTDVTVGVSLGAVPAITLVADYGSLVVSLSDPIADQIVRHAHHVVRFGKRQAVAS